MTIIIEIIEICLRRSNNEAVAEEIGRLQRYNLGSQSSLLWLSTLIAQTERTGGMKRLVHVCCSETRNRSWPCKFLRSSSAHRSCLHCRNWRCCDCNLPTADWEWSRIWKGSSLTSEESCELQISSFCMHFQHFICRQCKTTLSTVFFRKLFVICKIFSLARSDQIRRMVVGHGRGRTTFCNASSLPRFDHCSDKALLMMRIGSA